MRGNAIKVVVGLLTLLLLAVPLFGACAGEDEEPLVDKTILVGACQDFSGPTAQASGRLWTCAQEFFKWANETDYVWLEPR